MRRISCLLLLLLLCAGCSTRGLNDRYASATAQRLVSQSLDKLIKDLPQADLQRLTGQQVYLKSYFVEPLVAEFGGSSSLLAFADQRLRLELLERYACRFVSSPEAADYQLHFFFNAIGTDQDSLGLATPQLYLPSLGTTQIDFIALEMFHGVSEGYYYLIDQQQAEVLRGPLQKVRVRTDRLNLPFISIPLSTLD